MEPNYKDEPFRTVPIIPDKPGFFGTGIHWAVGLKNVILRPSYFELSLPVFINC